MKKGHLTQDFNREKVTQTVYETILIMQQKRFTRIETQALLDCLKKLLDQQVAKNEPSHDGIVR